MLPIFPFDSVISFCWFFFHFNSERFDNFPLWWLSTNSMQFSIYYYIERDLPPFFSVYSEHLAFSEIQVKLCVREDLGEKIVSPINSSNVKQRKIKIGSTYQLFLEVFLSMSCYRWNIQRENGLCFIIL